MAPMTVHKVGILQLARDCVVELVGLEPTTRVLWNTGVSDQLTLSDTKHSISKRAAINGHFYKREAHRDQFGLCRRTFDRHRHCCPVCL